MSKYTLTVRELIFTFGHDEILKWFSDYDLTHFLTPDEIEVINERGTWTKERLAEKIIDHFYMREIGLETPSLFRIRVRSKMRRLMEEKLPLIYSAAIKYDPMVNVDFTETYNEKHEDAGNRNTNTNVQTEGTSDSSSQTNSNGTSLQIESDTPQGQISKSKILEGAYASRTSANESESETTGRDNSTTQGTSQEYGNDTHNDNGTREYVRKQKGNSGTLTTAQALIKQYRDNIVAIDDEIINQLETLFMGLY